MSQDYEVAAYYFPQWHVDSHNEKTHGKGWTEWKVLKEAKPRFPGHEQPKVPAWGYLDEADPRVSEKQIAAATEHGIGIFLYDWYWNMGGKDAKGPFLQRALEEGFLKASNRDTMRFALMWANHTEISREDFDAMTDYIVEKYLHCPNYWRVNGKLYFTIYEIHTLIKGLGGLDETQAALDSFRAKVAAAGLPPLHFNVMAWGLQGDNPNAQIKQFGIDSVTSYVWAHNFWFVSEKFPDVPYGDWAQQAPKLWETLRDSFCVPYFPNVTVGWDSSPRTDQNAPYEPGKPYPMGQILVDNTPEAFEKSLRDAKDFLDRSKTTPKIVTLYAWNEWTEGGYLEPDTKHGMGYLEAIRNVFGR